MGIKLIVEVLDAAPGSLTFRERYALVILAENARDDTRLCWPGIEDSPEIARRLRMSRSQMYAVIKALIDKDALERKRRGQKGVRAVYRIPRFTVQRPENPDPERSVSVPETGTLTESQRPGSESSASRFPSFSVPETGTPSPQSPQDPSSLPVPERVIRTARIVAEHEEREFIAWIKDKHHPHSPGWWRTVSSNGDLASLAAEWREHAHQNAGHDAQAAARRAEIDACGRCDENGLTDEDTPRRCDHTPAARPTQIIPAPRPARLARTQAPGRPMPAAHQSAAALDAARVEQLAALERLIAEGAATHGEET